MTAAALGLAGDEARTVLELAPDWPMRGGTLGRNMVIPDTRFLTSPQSQAGENGSARRPAAAL